MNPLVSIVVPYRNHKRGLPRLLESVGYQSLKDLEVVVVDDHSEEGCADVAEAFSGRGLPVRLLVNEHRLYTKDTRLTGVLAAKSDCILFADADDFLWGETALEKHVALQRKTETDIVHFRSVLTDQGGNFVGLYGWADPLAPRLEGDAVFAAFARTEPDGWPIWNKLWSRRLWLRIMPLAKQSAIHWACEDIFLNICAFFYAQRYIGSDLTGYGYYYRPRQKGVKAMPRALALHSMLSSLMPKLRAAGGVDEDIRRLEGNIINFLSVCVGRAGMHALEEGQGMIAENRVREALQDADSETVIKTLLLAAGVNGRKLRDVCKTALGLKTFD
jgi:glycosyltransferase involved in cell wall biosynthesis